MINDLTGPVNGHRPMTRLRMFRWYVQNMWLYLRLPKADSSITAPAAYFDLHHNIFHRYLLDLMLMLRDQGFTIRLRHRPSLIGNWSTHLLFRFVPHIQLYFNNANRAGDLLFTDNVHNTEGIFLDPDYFNPAPADPNTYILPMPMVDSLYSKGLHTWFPRWEELERKRKLFFVGNMDPAYDHASDHLAMRFGCFSRNHLIQLILDGYRDRILRPSSPAELHSDHPKDIVLVDRKVVNIPHGSLRPTMARHDLFLAASGVIMPLCHNVIEALSVGCIPIIQHPSLLSPKLEHGVNCLAFDDEAGLKLILDRLPDMRDEEILRMRQNALHYYKTNLSPEAVVGKITAMGKDLRRIRMNAEHHSVKLMGQRQASLADRA